MFRSEVRQLYGIVSITVVKIYAPKVQKNPVFHSKLTSLFTVMRTSAKQETTRVENVAKKNALIALPEDILERKD